MPNVLFVFAHQDDEYSAAPWILEELADGATVACVYLTDGGLRVAPEVRDWESRRALTSLGVALDRIAFLSTPSGRIADGALSGRCAESVAELERWLQTTEFDPHRIYAPAYEGGHPDHDAAHVIAAVAAARRRSTQRCWHFALYNAYGRYPPFFSSLRQLPSASPARRAKLSLAERLKLAFLFRYYRSQVRTWIGIFPEAFLRRVGGQESVVRFDPSRLKSRPHAGKLLYERMFRVSYEAVSRHLAPLVDELCTPRG